MGDHWILWTIAALDVGARVALIFRVVMRQLAVPVALAWLILLIFVPFVGGIAYLLIGEHRLGARKALKVDALGRAKARIAMDQWASRAGPALEHKPAEQAIANLCSTVGGFPAMGGNSVELMDDAAGVLAKLTADIARAQHHCNLLYYIWQPTGGGAGMVATALMEAAQRGVECRVLVDAVGSNAFLKSEMCAAMRGAGVRVEPALTVSAVRMLFARIDLRNHRKLAVIDGSVAYCGSQNLTDETFRSRRTKKLGQWIDTTARLEGPCVHALQTIFLRDWGCDSSEELSELGRFFPHCPMIEDGSVVQVVPSGPGSRGPHAIHHALLAMLHAAREEVIMTTPYFVPDEAMRAALVNAVLRGVRVTLVLPDRLDAKLVAAASRSYYDELLAVGVTIMHHEDALLHAKTATIDRVFCLVTSANIDIRSFWLNFEASLFIYDKDVTGTLRVLQSKYISESRQVHLEEWRGRPFLQRFIDNVAQLCGPLL